MGCDTSNNINPPDMKRRATHDNCDHTHNPNNPSSSDEEESDEDMMEFGEGDYS